MQMLLSDWLSDCTLSTIRVQWLGVVDKTGTFSCFSKSFERTFETNNNYSPEKTKKRTFTVS